MAPDCVVAQQEQLLEGILQLAIFHELQFETVVFDRTQPTGDVVGHAIKIDSHQYVTP